MQFLLFSEKTLYKTYYKINKNQIDFYKYNNYQISNNFIKYDSFNTLSKEINVARDTIRRYLNTHVPYKNHY